MVALRQGGEIQLPGSLPSGLTVGPGALGSALRQLGSELSALSFLFRRLSSELRPRSFLLRSLRAELSPVSAFLGDLSFLAWALGGDAQSAEL